MPEKDVSECSGVLIVNKHSGVTSHDIINSVRRLYNTKKVGHTGTLDPMATGVLVILIGRAAKAAEFISCSDKEYIASLRLGMTTDTEDITGNILTETDTYPSYEQVLDACLSFVGNIEQTPPMYSAVKINGRKLVDLARKGMVIERNSRKIEIKSLKVTPTDTPSEYILDVVCSSGTYIRTLCADIGSSLNCGGVMAGLNRRRVGNFYVEASHSIDQLKLMTYEQRLNLLIPTEELFTDCPCVFLSEFYEKLCRSGCEIYQKKIGVSFVEGTRVRIYSQNGRFFSIGEVKQYENGTALKSLKLFDLG